MQEQERDDPSAARPYARLAVLGAGAWGSALAVTAARAGGAPALWARRAELARLIAETGRNPDYLGDAPVPEDVRVTSDLHTALTGAEAALLAVPAHATAATAREAHAALRPDAPLVICAKGFDPEGDRLLTESVAEAAPGRPVAVLSGPSFARETARGLPTAVVVAAAGRLAHGPEAPPARLAATLAAPGFRAVPSDDPVGVQIGGAVKNVIAIACGLAIGAGLGENARAALISFGLEESAAIAEALGGRRETALGLAGAGDMMLSCVSEGSRNYAFGVRLGAGRRRDAPVETTEGVRSAGAVARLAKRVGADAPVSRAVCRIVHERAPIGETFADLWGRSGGSGGRR